MKEERNAHSIGETYGSALALLVVALSRLDVVDNDVDLWRRRRVSLVFDGTGKEEGKTHRLSDELLAEHFLALSLKTSELGIGRAGLPNARKLNPPLRLLSLLDNAKHVGAPDPRDNGGPSLELSGGSGRRRVLEKTATVTLRFGFGLAELRHERREGRRGEEAGVPVDDAGESH